MGGKKNCGKRRNCSLRAISPFPTVFFLKTCTAMFEERVKYTRRSFTIECSKNLVSFQEMLNLKKQMFGDLNALSKDEYLGFYNSTGIDIDGRYKNFRNFVADFQNKIKNIIRFSKSIPGFKDLAQSDQINLIKRRYQTFELCSGKRGA